MYRGEAGFSELHLHLRLGQTRLGAVYHPLVAFEVPELSVHAREPGPPPLCPWELTENRCRDPLKRRHILKVHGLRCRGRPVNGGLCGLLLDLLFAVLIAILVCIRIRFRFRGR